MTLKIGRLAFSSNDYREELAKLTASLRNLGNEKAFVFIDPYEYKHIKASHIKDLMNNGKTEVLLWLPTQFMYRFSEKGTPDSLHDFIQELVPDQASRKESTDIWEFIEKLKTGFEIFMGSSYFVDSFSIEKDKGTVFCMFFFSSHIKGFEKMLDAKWEIDEQHGKGWDYTGNKQPLFEFESKTNRLEEKLIERLAKEPVSNGEVYEFTLRHGFLPKHAVEILSHLQNTDRLDVVHKEGASARKGAFYINYENYRDNSDRISMKLKG